LPRTGFGAVFATYETRKSQAANQIEQVGVRHLATVGLMPVRNPGDLNMGNTVEVFFQAHAEIAFHNLAVVEVHLDFQVRRADLGNQIVRMLLVVEEVTRHVTRVDR
jgi:hypothetical protein